MLESLKNFFTWLLGNVPPPSLAPHEKFPEILDWVKGDHLECDGRIQYRYVSITEDGKVYMTWFNDNYCYSLDEVIKNFFNRSLRNRRLDKELKQTNEYMQLLTEFNIAVKQLKARDIEKFGSEA